MSKHTLFLNSLLRCSLNPCRVMFVMIFIRWKFRAGCWFSRLDYWLFFFSYMAVVMVCVPIGIPFLAAASLVEFWNFTGTGTCTIWDAYFWLWFSNTKLVFSLVLTLLICALFHLFGLEPVYCAVAFWEDFVVLVPTLIWQGLNCE